MAYLDETGDPVLDALYKELDAIKGNTRAESLRRIELKDQIRAIREQQGAMRDLGVGSLRFGAFMTMAPEIDWLANKMATNVGYPMMLASEEYQSFPQKEKEDFRNLWLAAQGERGDEQHQEYAKKKFNKYHDMGFLPWMEQVPEFIDELVPFEKTLGSEAVEDAELLLVLGWGIHGIAKLFSWAATKGIPKGRVWLRNKIKSIVKNKQGEEILDDIVPEASQYPIQQQFDARIDKTVERATAGEKVKSTTGYDRTTPRPRTRPKTGEEIKQNLDHELAIVGARYDQELTAIHNSPPAGKMTPEKTDQLEKLRRKQKSIYAEIEKQMVEDFAYLEELAFDEKLITTPEHFQGLKETQYSNYTVKMLGDESNKLQRWVEKELKKSLEESKKAGQEAVEKVQAKIKKAKNETEKDTIMAEFKAELNRIDETKALRDKEIDHVFYEKYNELKDALNSIGREMDLLESGAVTRHSRGGLVENKVNYALNQWK